MIVEHNLKGSIISKEVKDASFILTNSKGAYLYLSEKPVSKYQGFFFNKNHKMFRTIANIMPDPYLKLTKLVNHFSHVIFERGKVKEEFFLPDMKDTFVYTVQNYSGDIIVDLDCYETNSTEHNAYYNITLHNNKVMVEYESEGNYKFYLLFKFQGMVPVMVKKLKKQTYALDKKHGDNYVREVFTGFKFKVNGHGKLVVACSFNKKIALKNVNYCFRNYEQLKSEKHNKLFFNNKIKDKDVMMAYNAAVNSLNSLYAQVNNEQGIYAGLPWFYQFWARDELISLNVFKHVCGRRNETRSILKRHLSSIEHDGRIPNRIPGMALSSIDAIGWFYYRFNKKIKLKEVIDALNKYHIKNGYLVAEPNETWMDSRERKGAMVEIQALLLNMYKLLGNRGSELKLKQKVKKEFWNGKYLADGLGDWIIRPNIFIAAYVYPELLSKKEWITCFQFVLDDLWNDWGGLASVDKNSKFYEPISTYKVPLSYHNGDSWYYINNMAALVMKKLGAKQFNNYIRKILAASTHEILWSGAVGHHAEVSSSIFQESAGCLMQAWSAAMYIELINELFQD